MAGIKRVILLTFVRSACQLYSTLVVMLSGSSRCTLRLFLDRAERLLEQTRTSQSRLYSIDAPEVKCISKRQGSQAL